MSNNFKRARLLNNLIVRVRILSIDIGLKNFAQYVEEIPENDILEIRRKIANGVSKEECARIVSGYGVPIELSVHDLTVATANTEEKTQSFSIDDRKSVIRHLDGNIELFKTCNIVVIEQQFFNSYSFGKKTAKGGEANVKAIKIAEVVTTWFLINLPQLDIVIFPSVYKTSLFGAPAKMTKPQRKKWAVEYMMGIFRSRGDETRLEFLKTTKKIRKQKLDDMCDAALQCQAYKIKMLSDDAK